MSCQTEKAGSKFNFPELEGYKTMVDNQERGVIAFNMSLS